MAGMIEDFDNAIEISGVNNSTVKPSDVEDPIRGYVGNRGQIELNGQYRGYAKEFEKQVGEGSVIEVNATHGTSVKESYILDEDNDGISDMFEWIFSNYGEEQQNSARKETNNKTKNEQVDISELTINNNNRNDTSAFFSAEKDKEILDQKQWEEIKKRAETSAYWSAYKDEKVTEVYTKIRDVAKEEGLDIKGKTASELLAELAEKYDVAITGNGNKKVDIDQSKYNQLLYGNVLLGRGGESNIQSGGCFVSAYALMASIAMGQEITPDVLLKTIFPEINNYYKKGSGTGQEALYNEKYNDRVNLEFIEKYDWGKAWGEKQLMKALEEGKLVMWRTKDKKFTKGGHWLLLTGLTEDGNIQIFDPNGANWTKSHLKDGFENGFAPKWMSQRTGSYYVFDIKDPTLTGGKSNRPMAEVFDEVMANVKENPSETVVEEQIQDDANTNLAEDTSTTNEKKEENKQGFFEWFSGVDDFFADAFDKLIGKDEEKTYTEIEAMEVWEALNNNKESNIQDNPLTESIEKDPWTAKQQYDQAEHFLEILAQKNDVDTNGKTTKEVLEETGAKILAKENGIDTEGKTTSELVDNLAKEKGVDQTKIITIKHDSAAALQEWYKDRGSNKNPPEADIETRYYDIKDPENKYNMAGLAHTDENGNQKGLLHKLGFKDVEISVREDGVFIASGYTPENEYFEDMIIVAADTYHSEKNPDGKFKRGQKVMTSLGPGMILDYCGRADWDYDDVQGIVDYEIATAWRTEPYKSMLENGTLPVVEWEEEVTVAKTDEEILNEILQMESEIPVAGLMGTFKENLQGSSGEIKDVKVNANQVNAPKDKETSDDASPITKSPSGATPTEKVPEIPLLDQNDYADVTYFRQGNLADDGCGIVTYSMALTYLFDDTENYTPEILAKKYEGTYGGDWGTRRQLFDETPQEYGLEVENVSPWEGFGKNNKIIEALENGQPVVALIGPESGLVGYSSDGTPGAHYVLLTGINEEGKITVNDPNGKNYEKGKLKDKFENGFDIETFSQDSRSGYWIFPSKEDVQKK